MKTLVLDNVAIKAIASAIPSNTITKDEFIAMYDEKEVLRTIRGTGISSVRADKNLSSSELMMCAAKNILDSKIIDRCDIDALIVVTQTPDFWSPGISHTIHHQLNLREDCLALDLNSGCSGYVNGIIQAGSLIASGIAKNVILCTGDVTSKLLSEKDRHVKMLFGDAGSATLLSFDNNKMHLCTGVDGSGAGQLGVDIDYNITDERDISAHVGRLHMDGAAVLNFALNRVPSTINQLLETLQKSVDMIDLFILHQPNEFILNYLKRIMKIEDDKFIIDVDGIGNTNSTSIPLALCRYAERSKTRLQSVVLSGFGVGLSWNALHTDLSDTCMMKPLEI